MTYQALARKWRPQDFSSLIGQEPVVTALRNALTEGRVAQAYLFAGIRGVGKTTAARVLAKALNCERGSAGDPCNECQACSEITEGADLDVLEVDAATYSKVEQIRELTESLRYGPAHNRYKVVVLDEVHRLSRQAFDALLKIVEEPPPHLVFIFATTEIEAVPATILSRCQEYHFRRVPAVQLAEHLARLAKAEEISISPGALRLVARAGDGSVRDAVALLDQLATYGAGTVDDDAAGRLLAGFDPALFHRLLAATFSGDGRAIQQAVREVEDEGRDPRQIFAGLLSYGRDALHLALGASAGTLDLPTEEAERLEKLVAKTSYENLLRWTHHLLQSEGLIRRSEAAGLALEIALLRAAELPKLTRIEELFGREPTHPVTATSPSTPREPKTEEEQPPIAAPATTDPEEAAKPKRPGPADEDRSEVPSEEHQAPSTEVEARDTPARVPTGSSESLVTQLLNLISRDRQVLAAHLRQAQELSFEGRQLVIRQDPNDGWLGQALERGGNRATLEAALAELCGTETSWVLRDGRADLPREPDNADDPSEPSSADHDPAVQAVLQIFDGSIDRSRD